MFYRAIEKKKYPSPSLYRLIGFRAQQAAFFLTRETGSADYRYFEEHGWFDRRRKFYTDVRVNPVKDLIARLVGYWVRRSVKRELADEIVR